MAGGSLRCPSFRVPQPHRWLCRCPHQNTGHPAPGAAPRSEAPLCIWWGPGCCQGPQGCRLPALHICMGRTASTAACTAYERCVGPTPHMASSVSPAQSWAYGNLIQIRIHPDMAKPQTVGWDASWCRVKRETHQCCALLAWQSWCARLRCAQQLQRAGAGLSPALPGLWWSLLHGLNVLRGQRSPPIQRLTRNKCCCTWI